MFDISKSAKTLALSAAFLVLPRGRALLPRTAPMAFR